MAQTFFVDEDVRTKASLDAIITIVDAKNLFARLEDSQEAEEQVAFADVILLNKVDLVTADELDAVEVLIRTINPRARRLKSTKADVPIEDLLGRRSFDLSRILEIEPDFLTGKDDHEHDDGLTSVSLTHPGWTVNALLLWKLFRRKRACSIRGERALLNYLDQCEAMELAASDAL